MCRKLMFLASLVLLLGLTRGASAQYLYVPKATTHTVTAVETYDDFYVAGTLIVESSGSLTSGYGSTLNGTGARIIVNGGSVLIQGRFNVGQEGGGYITMNGGTFTVTDTFKFPDGAGGVHRIYLNDGIMHSQDIQLYWDRDAIIYVSGGILRLTNVEPGHTDYDPAEWIKQGALLPTGEYDEIVIEDKNDFTEVTAVSLFSRVKFETETSEALESVSPALLAVTLSQPVAATVTVDYAVAGGTANIVEDYNLAAGTLTFDPCDINEAISIDIVNDGVNENDETIIVELSNPNGPGVLLGSTSQHTYIILDPRPGVGFDTPSGDGMENVTPADIAVSLSAPLAETVTVEYAVTGGTATGGGVDYTLLGDGTLQFDPCEVTKYISIDIVDDAVAGNSETVELTLSNPSSNAKLSLQDQYIYTIVDNEEGVAWDGLVWYYSDDPTRLFVNQAGQLEWTPEQLGQFITRLPEEDFNYPGATVEISYMWMTDGEDDCPPDTCLICDRCSDDIRCIAGTSDMRVGLFEADGQYIESDVFDIHNYVFEGYKGYAFRFGPNMDEDIPVRWTDCDGEVHKTGDFQKKPEGSDNLMKINEGLSEDYIPGFGLPPGEFSYFSVKLERLSSSSVKLSITLNDRTYTWTDDSSSEQPHKIDVLAVHMRNGRPYSRLVLASLVPPPVPTASDPSPIKGAEGVLPDAVLSWTPGDFATSHDVYFGANWDNVEDANSTNHPNVDYNSIDANSYDPCGLLEWGKTYYWRIDEVNNSNLWEGEAWYFTVGHVQAHDPSPYDYAENVPWDAVVSWTPADLAADPNAHNVYLGTDFDKVNDANTSSSEYKGSQDLVDTSYDPPGLLDFGQIYYWRIDEVNDANGDKWKGEVWSFTTANYVSVDDFELYDESSLTPDPCLVYIPATQEDGIWRDVTSDPLAYPMSLAFLDTNSTTERGTQSMAFMYNNQPAYCTGYSEAWRPYEADLLNTGVKALSVWFYGSTLNDEEKMYVGLQSADGKKAEVYYPNEPSDPNIKDPTYYQGKKDLTKEDWHEWHIKLEDFTFPQQPSQNDVNLASVNAFFLGFGDRENPVKQGSGMYSVVYFDDIRVYIPRCVAVYGPEADLSGDCIVDLGDIKVVRDEWLTSGIKADLVDDDNVNFKDYAVIVDSWLDEKWFPEGP